MTDDKLYSLSDEELEAAFKTAKEEGSEVAYDEDTTEQFDNQDQDATADDIYDDDDMSMDDDTVDADDEITSDLDQPDADSNHDTGTEDDDSTEADKDSETDSDSPDGDTEATDDNPEADNDVESDDVQPTQKHLVKANGREYEFTMDEIVTQFPRIFGQAMDYTKKMQAIKPWRKTIDAIQQAELAHEDINLMIDALKGDKGAISEVLKRTGVDTLDLDTEESTYVAKEYGRDETTLEISEVVDSISSDPEFATTRRILSSQWDDDSWNAVSENPKMIALLHDDVKTGVYDKIQPIIDKLKLFETGRKKSEIEYYGMAAQEYYDGIAREQRTQQRAETVASQEAEQVAKTIRNAEVAKLAQVEANSKAREAKKTASNKRKAAAPTKSIAGQRKDVDYLNASDEEFDEWYERTMSAI